MYMGVNVPAVVRRCDCVGFSRGYAEKVIERVCGDFVPDRMFSERVSDKAVLKYLSIVSYIIRIV